MQNTRRFGLALATVFLLPLVAVACLWDYDTLAQERGRFPSTLELITGKFLRHSPEFYEWRIEDRLKKLEKDPNNLNYHDDLAAAYSKIGNFDKAIEVMQRKEKIQPGLYETYSNLGTFYILAGRFKEGLPYIDKALAINPDAHFGREKYQKYLVEYVLAKMKDQRKLTFPLVSAEAMDKSNNLKFDAWLNSFKKTDPNSDDRHSAVKGILGMMRFADYKNPILLEALGNLLWSERERGDGKQLATRAFLQASYFMKVDDQREEYRKLAKAALRMKQGVTLELVESAFQKELADAEKWYDDLRAKEIDWIKAGLNADEEFDKLYAQDPHIGGEEWEPGRQTWIQYFDTHPTVIVFGLLACLLLIIPTSLLLCKFAYRRICLRRANLPG
ncbi:hypothetical protein KIH39_18865 [Telmatocola sphagniphila]|uniref:Tetratricopeptide repeat protein n=1 Tax=Telmatocola sphagniphila TaxID=1123043 RepID=A0A8E6B2U7_9BACT|nr:hypothetical protein [Telmatocola sphagniphila]QVL30898.1 hypothetical protein KIH39_18865 [Telmatocola sphagniphila]